MAKIGKISGDVFIDVIGSFSELSSIEKNLKKRKDICVCSNPHKVEVGSSEYFIRVSCSFADYEVIHKAVLTLIS